MSFNNSPTQEGAAGAAFSFAPWAFEAAYSQPLPPAFQFDPYTGFTHLSDYIVAMSQGRQASLLPRINPHIATYKNGKTKASWMGGSILSQEGMGGSTLSQQERDDYSCGATISVASKDWRAGGSIGVVTSSMSNASE
ncbi:hypothetical protein EJ02DRAFT_497159, partial [Clathrospora elynae]